MSPAKVLTDELDFHRGNILLAVSKTYPSLPLTAVECVQNAIDGDATLICVVFDLEKRAAFVADNGRGVTPDLFAKALQSVGSSIKKKDRLGRFGRGLISPLGKCDKYLFSSQAEGGAPMEWTFERARIQRAASKIEIPRRGMATLPTIPTPFRAAADDLGTKWRTVVSMIGLLKDRTITMVNLDNFEETIIDKFGEVMFERGIKVRVMLRETDGTIMNRDIVPIPYSGEQLPVFTVESDTVGKVRFELYRAVKRRGKLAGRVKVTELDSSSGVTWSEFMRQARAAGWHDTTEGFSALGSGFFEGVIKAENITLHEERTKFEYDESLVDLYTVIDQWFETVGRDLYDQDRRRSIEERHQALGQQSMDRLRELLADPKNSRLRDLLLNGIAAGRVSPTDHTPREGELEDDPSERSLAPADPDKPPSGGSGRPRKQPTKDRPSDTPVGTKGPRGQRRKVVGDDSIGLWLSHEPFERSTRLWEFDHTQGLLAINTLHPLWKELDEPENPRRSARNDKWILGLQDWLIIKVLSLLTIPQELWEEHRAAIDLEQRPFVERFVRVTR